MMVKRLSLLGVFVVLILASCAPKAAPVTPTAPAAAPAPAPSSPPSALSPEEAAWVQVVAAAKKEGVVNAYSIILPADVGRAVSRAFFDRYGIKLNVVVAVGAVSIERIKSEQAGGKYIADTLDTAVALLMTAKESQLTQAVGNLPALVEANVWVSPPQIDPEGHLFAVGPNLLTPFVNTNLVKAAEEPKSWLDLLDARWKGKMGMGSPDADPLIVYIYLVRAALGLDDDYFRRLGQQDLKVYVSSRDPPRYLAQGDIHLVVTGASVIAGPLANEGAPIKAVAMKEGTVDSGGSTIGLIKGAPHPNAARVFINWLLSREGQQVYSQARAIRPIRADVPDSTPASLRFTPTKVAAQTLSTFMEASRIQRDGSLARLMGLGR